MKTKLGQGAHVPFVYTNWERLVFLHFTADPEIVRPSLPAPFELELYQGKACVSLAAVTMKSFSPVRLFSSAWLVRPIAQQQFLNFRAYVRHHGEPGALFLWGWLSRPLRLPLPSGMFGLPYAFANLKYDHRLEDGVLRGAAIDDKDPTRRFVYRATLVSERAAEPASPVTMQEKKGDISVNCNLSLCAPGSLAEFAMERGTGFFCRRLGFPRSSGITQVEQQMEPFAFRAWHPQWLQSPIDAVIEEDSLVKAKFPWFREARLAGANFAPGFERVRLGRAHRLGAGPRAHSCERSVLSGFYKMP
jgi:Uncharacterized conserved protein (COG2071)